MMDTLVKGKADLLKIRDLVIQDPIALGRWPLVVDDIVDSPADNLRMKKLILGHSQYEEAILQSLDMWYASGQRTDLVEVFRRLGLNRLAGILQEEFGDGPKRNRFQMKNIWFEMGEVIHNFTGRTIELESLHALLTESHSRRSVNGNLVGISGLGGVGKTLLARAYAFEHYDFYDGNAMWINGSSGESMRASFARLAEELGLQISAKALEKDMASEIYQKLSGKKCLIIFDNVDDRKKFKQFQPRITNPNRSTPYILLTSRRRDVIPMQRNLLHLEVLSMEEATTFIHDELPTSEIDDVKELAKRLQGLPLALQQAVAYIKATPWIDQECISKYLQEFEQRAATLLNDKRFQDDNEYSHTVFTTWTVTLQRIRNTGDGKEAIRLINAMSYMDPDRISQALLIRMFDGDASSGLGLLRKFSMINVTSGIASIHRLVQRVIRLDQSTYDELACLRILIPCIAKDFSGLSPANTDSLLHALQIFPFQIKHVELVNGEYEYLNKLCQNLHTFGYHEQALGVARQTSKFYEIEYGNQREETLAFKVKEAAAYLHLRDYNEARRLLELLIPLAKANLGEGHQVTVEILNLIVKATTEGNGSQEISQDHAGRTREAARVSMLNLVPRIKRLKLTSTDTVE